uniref:Uncharacterized protein n=1 Tax=Myoviridae sp. ctMnh10 TaxID=2827682 RepID=A0A8S5TI53_9CAUD|nr:MAG TPA: hypothetical protein [Myoviridae sp. ctMnh10]
MRKKFRLHSRTFSFDDVFLQSCMIQSHDIGMKNHALVRVIITYVRYCDNRRNS